MAKIYNNITETIGKTPLVRLNHISEGLSCDILGKLESFNPCSSVKDRIGYSIIETAEKEGKIKSGGTVIEATSGNTGIGLAFVCASKGYKLKITMPESMSIERRKLLKTFGAEVILTDASKGMSGAVEMAKEIAENTPNSFLASQFTNPANPNIHRKTTAIEIWNDTDGLVDIVVCGIGTGGTITGIGEVLKQKKPSIKIYAIEPSNSAVLSGDKPGAHKIQGIGAGFIPEVLNTNILDGIVKISDDNAGIMARRLASEEGILAGISSGAAVAGALEVVMKEECRLDKTLVVILPDTGERYLSTWLWEEDYL